MNSAIARILFRPKSGPSGSALNQLHKDGPTRFFGGNAQENLANVAKLKDINVGPRKPRIVVLGSGK